MRIAHALRAACLPLGLLAVCLLAPLSAGADCDLALPLFQRMEQYLRENEVDGVTMDWRYSVSPSEEVRQTVVCQILGYAELYGMHPTAGVRCEIVRHADFLLARLDSVRSHTPFDGMLGYCMLAAYDCTREPRFRDAAQVVLDEVMAIPTSQCVLNGGLMVAMATARAWRVFQDTLALQKTHDILVQLGPYQNRDGSFPHWCVGSEDIHYTGWMAQELNVIQRDTWDPLIGPMLWRMHHFLAARVDSTGMSHYEGPCPDVPGCTQYYYSRASGCSYDYDTRGWTVEPAYTALMMDRYGTPEYVPVMGFLLSLEHGGTFPDLWDYWPPPSDPEYPWTIADTSVVNMSIMFWTLSCMLAQHPPCPGMSLAWAVDDDTAGCASPPETTGGPPEPVLAFTLRPPAPNPARSTCLLRFVLPAALPVRLAVYDAAGRLVRVVMSGTLPPGEHAAPWDLRDAAGRRCRGGLYFVRLESDIGSRATRALVLP